MQKFVSGRLFLTVVAGIVFAYSAWKRLLSPGEIATITTMVFTLYFSRTDRTPPTNGGTK